jgi:hypothetical protein
MSTIDITPTPRILRTLGEIPFEPWQCLAELIDNSIDIFLEASRVGTALEKQAVTISWSGDQVADKNRTIEVVDTGTGMSIDQIQNAARAGYSSNDPIHNLGLFGMGFNIATARLSEKTKLLSTRQGDQYWVGIEIDFSQLISTGNFMAPLIQEPKSNTNEHGTKIVLSQLKKGMYSQFRDRESQIRRQLENIYSPLLSHIDIDVSLQGKRLTPKHHCVWAKTRYVIRDKIRIPAVLEIDKTLGEALFDIEKNTYLSRDDEVIYRRQESEGNALPKNIIVRHKRLRGWIGIQRYSDPNDFGIDFIRNGRKILISNKSIFSYENPLTGTTILEYPVELGSTVGGRIIGELNVDYLLPTYQKNGFDTSDPSWKETLEALRGIGPILPKRRKAMGYEDKNTSPLGLLISGYRRPDPGTKNLSVERSIAREFLERFRKGEPEYISDDKWWESAQESDRSKATQGAELSPEVDPGSLASDDVSEYISSPEETGALDASSQVFGDSQASSEEITEFEESSSHNDLLSSSREMVSWSGKYTYSDAPGFQVRVREVIEGSIIRRGHSVPCEFFADGIECYFFFNPRHPFLAQFPVDPRIMLSVYLAERFKTRDNLSDIGEAFISINQSKLQDVKINPTTLQEKASTMFERLRERMFEAFKEVYKEVLDCIQESSGETEETINNILSDSNLIISFQEHQPKGLEVIDHVPLRTLIRLVDRFPGKLFDGKVFQAPYRKINISDENATQRARDESKDRIISFLKDASWILGKLGAISASGRAKDEFARCSHSINFLSQELED